MAFGMNVPGLSSGYDIVAMVKLSGDDAFNRQLTGMDTKVKMTGKVMGAALGAAILLTAKAFQTSVKAAVEFEAQMANVNTLLDDTDMNFDNLNQGVLDIASSLPVSFGSLTKGLYDLISAGVSSADAIGALELASKAATAGITGVDVAVKAGTATINAYAMDISQLNYVYDLQFMTVKKGVLTYEQLASSLGNVLPAAANLGVSLEDLHGAIAHITKSGIEAQSASTFLARAFESMTENRDDWEKLGVAIFDATGEFRGLLPVMGDLNQMLAGLTTEQKLAKLEALDMEKRAAKAILTMANNYQGLSDTIGAMEGSAGAMNSAFQKVNKTFDSQWKILKNQFGVVLREVGKELLPYLTDAVVSFGEALRGMMPILKIAISRLGSLPLPLKIALEVLGFVGGKLDEMGRSFEEASKKSTRFRLLTEHLQKQTDKAAEAFTRHSRTMMLVGDETMSASEAMDYFGGMLDMVRFAAEENEELEIDLQQSLMMTTAAVKEKTAAVTEERIALNRYMAKMDEVIAGLDDGTISLNDMTLAMRDSTESTGGLITEIEGMTKLELDKMLGSWAGNAEDFYKSLGMLSSRMGQIGKVGKIASAGMNFLIGSFKGGEEGAMMMADAFAELAAGAGDAIESLTGLEGIGDIISNMAYGAIGFFQSMLNILNEELAEGEDAIGDWWDAMKEALGGLQDEISDLPYSNILLDELNQRIENLGNQIAAALNAGEDPAELAAQLALLEEALAGFAEAAMYDQAFLNLMNNLQGMADYYTYFEDMYGTGAPGLDALREQLEAQFLAAYNLLQTLDPTSQAYQMLLAVMEQAGGIIGWNVDLWLQLGQAIILVGVISVDIEKVGERVGDLTGGLGDLGDAFYSSGGAISAFRNEWEQLSSELMGEFDFVSEGMGSLTDFIEELQYMGQPISDFETEINAALSSWAAYMETLDPDSQAYADAMAEYQAIIDLLASLGIVPIIDPDAIFTPPDTGGGSGYTSLIDAILADLDRLPTKVAIDIGLLWDDIKYGEINTILYDFRNFYSTINVSVEPSLDESAYNYIIDKLNNIPTRIDVDIVPGYVPSEALAASPDASTAAASASRPVVNVYEANPETWTEITDQSINPRIEETADYTAGSGYHEA